MISLLPEWLVRNPELTASSYNDLFTTIISYLHNNFFFTKAETNQVAGTQNKLTTGAIDW